MNKTQLLKQLSLTKSRSEQKLIFFKLGVLLGEMLVAQNPKIKYFYLVYASKKDEDTLRGVISVLELLDKKFNISAQLNYQRYEEFVIPKAKPLVVFLPSFDYDAHTNRMKLMDVFEDLPKKLVVLSLNLTTKQTKEYSQELPKQTKFLNLTPKPLRIKVLGKYREGAASKFISSRRQVNS